MKRTILIVLGIAMWTIAAILFFGNSQKTTLAPAAMSSQGSVVTTEGKQVIEISAKGGYLPRTIAAKAGTPTVLKMKTSGTFDCSSALVIPSLGYRANLPSSGETLIEVPSQKAGSTLRGVCAMGMYSFEISFS
jgi:plastocyanin domain-containing protein